MNTIPERISELEVRGEFVSATVTKHEKELDDIKGKLTLLVSEVKQIRNALYVMALALAGNIPALQGLPKLLLSLFSN